jgi:hypothetical protein
MSLLLNFTAPTALTSPLLVGPPVATTGGSIDSIPSLTLVSTVPVSATLELQGTASGLLLNRVTTIERDAIVTPANGMLVYNTTTDQLNIYAASAWTIVEASGGAIVSTSIQNGAGTVALPSYTFTGDTNTGMWSSAADVIDFSSAGARTLQVEGTGALAISGGTSAGGIRLWNQANTFWSLIKSAAVASNLTWTWPLIDSAVPAGGISTTTAIPMSSNASGVLAFSNTGMAYATGTITSQNIIDMATTGVTLLGTPGVGFAYVIHSFGLELIGGTAYGNGGTVYLQYGTTGAGTVTATAMLPATAVTAASTGNNTFATVNGLIGANKNGTTLSGTQQTTAATSNAVISITASTAFITGTGTAKWYIWYSIVPIT